MKAIYILYIAMAASAWALSGCGGKTSVADELQREESTNTKVADDEIYTLGHQAGEAMLRECTDMEQIELRLLDTRARINLIRGRVDDQAASDYTHGFTDAIRENCDSLAQMLELK